MFTNRILVSKRRERMFLLVLFLLASCTKSHERIVISGVPNHIIEGSPRELANYIFLNSDLAKKATDQIQAGQKEWLRLYPKLLFGSDGGGAEGLLSLVPYALKTNPKEALEAIKRSEELIPQLKNIAENYCGSTKEGYDEESPQNTLAVSSLRELEARTRALKTVENASLLKIKNECIAGIEYSTNSWKKVLNNPNSRVEEECKKINKTWDRIERKCL